jgi:uncharacterized repeat protein (TIGR02543 family)
MDNCGIPNNCATATCAESCECSGTKYKVYANGTTEGNTTEHCTKDVISVTANANYYANGTICTRCPSEWEYSENGNSGGCDACYTIKPRTCVQNKCINPDPTRCYKAVCESSCECEGGTYIQYANNTCDGNGIISGKKTESCTKDVDSLIAYYGYHANGTESCVEDEYSIEYVLNDGEFIDESAVPYSYTSDSDDIMLPIPIREESAFMGWCDDVNLSVNCLMPRIIPHGSTGNKKYYAKWEFVCESGKWLHINNEKLCLYNIQKTHPALAISINGDTYYGKLTPNLSTPIHKGSRKKMHLEMRSGRFNVYDGSVDIVD